MSKAIRVVLLAVALALAVASAARSQETAPAPDTAPGTGAPPEAAAEPMDNERLGALIRRLDPQAEGQAGFWRFTVREREVLVITDERVDRMRIITPVIKAEELEPRYMYRLLQANFDSALDARYAVGRDVVWSVFIHPLRSLRDADFVSGVGQVINLAETFGSSYSSGALVFGGGDSGELRRRELIDRLLKKGLEM